MPVLRSSVLVAICAFVLAASAGAQQVTMGAEQEKIRSILVSMFAAAQVDDAARFDTLIAPGFYMFDGGKRFDGDAIIGFLKSRHAAGMRFEWNVTDPDIHMMGDTAWVAYVNRGSVTDATGRTTKMTWLESAFLERRDGAWKLVFFHSTRVPAPPAEKQSGL